MVVAQTAIDASLPTSPLHTRGPRARWLSLRYGSHRSRAFLGPHHGSALETTSSRLDYGLLRTLSVAHTWSQCPVLRELIRRAMQVQCETFVPAPDTHGAVLPCPLGGWCARVGLVHSESAPRWCPAAAGQLFHNRATTPEHPHGPTPCGEDLSGSARGGTPICGG